MAWGLTYEMGDVIYYEDRGGNKFIGLVLDPCNGNGFQTVLWRDRVRQYVYDEANLGISDIIKLGHISDFTSEHPEVEVYE